MPGLGRRVRPTIDIWPGFVDALASLLMVIMFMVLVFVLSQFYLSSALTGRDQTISKLNAQLAQLAEMLDLEQRANATLKDSLGKLTTDLAAANDAKDKAQAALAAAQGAASAANTQLSQLTTQLAQVTAERDKLKDQLAAAQKLATDNTTKLADAAKQQDSLQGQLTQSQKDLQASAAQVLQLTQAMDALKQELARISAALAASEQVDTDQKVQIANLGQRLNEALASKVEELARFRSEFFGRIRQILGDNAGVRIEGDRFVFQSEVLFASGSDQLDASGVLQLTQLASTLAQVTKSIPKDINWVLRVDGHTDRNPIHSDKFGSNWELSTARAVSVVKFLADHGIPPDRLAATGFGEYQPLDNGDSTAALARNRRIEIRLDSK